MGFRFVHGFFVGVSTPENPSSEAWQAHCVEVARVRDNLRGALIYTEGGGPNSKQRQALRDVHHQVEIPPTAILTASAVARCIMTGLNWFFPNSRLMAFAPGDVKKALDYLAQAGELPRDDLVNALISLAEELSVKLPFTPHAATGGSRADM
jgi:hypothetical protein